MVMVHFGIISVKDGQPPMEKDRFMPVLRSLTAIALPVSLARIVNVLANFIAMKMVAQLGSAPLAAAALAVSTTMVVLTSVMTIFYSVSILIRYYRGHPDSLSKIDQIVKSGWLLAILLALPLAIGLCSMNRLLLAFGQDVDLVMLTDNYFYFMSIAVVPLLITVVIGQYYVGKGRIYFPLLMELFSFPLMIFLSYGFILGHFGWPRLGLGGLGLATAVVQVLLLLLCLGIFYYDHRSSHWWRRSSWDWAVCRAILKLGFPMGVQFGGELAAIAVSTYFMGYFGVTALAVLQMVNQYAMLVIMLYLGLAHALSLLVSEAHGDGAINSRRIKQYIGISVLLLCIYCTPAAVLWCGFSEPLATFYMGAQSLDPIFIHMAEVFFRISAVFLYVDGIRHLLSGLLRGLHDSQAALRINVGALWLVSIPLSGVVIFIGSPLALRMAFLSGFIVSVVFLMRYLSRVSRSFIFSDLKIDFV